MRFPYNTLAVISAGQGTKMRAKSWPEVRKETIRPGAFSYAIEDPTREIHALVGHDYSKPLGSKLTGSAMFDDTPESLIVTIPELPPTEFARNAHSLVAAGLMAGVSPRFIVPGPDTVPNAETVVPEPGNPAVGIREIAAAVLLEISLVTRPAYQDSAAEARSQTVPKPKIWLL